MMMLCTIFSQAQIFSENFNSGTIPATFTLTDVDGLTPNSTSWPAGSFFANNLTTAGGIAEDCAQSVSWFNPVGQADDWMVTPAITIPMTSNGVSLFFDALGWESAYPDGVMVYVSTTGTSPADFLSSAPLYNSTPTTAGPNPQGGEADVWTTRSVDLSSFVGQTIYIAFRNNSTDMNILGIDNIIVNELQDNNAELASLNITPYSAAPANINIEGTAKNIGGNVITAMDITWSDGTNSYTDNMSGLNILPNTIYNFTHSNQLNMTMPGTVNITVTIDNVNSSSDPDMSNNTLTATANIVSFLPTKRVVFEEATGTWCGWCPRGAVALETLEQNYPNTAIGIAVHNGDAMTVTAYDAGMSVGGYPSGHVDRAILDIDPGDFMQYYSSRINEITPVDISATANFDPTSRLIDINLTAEFVSSLSGDIRFNAVILEDQVGPYNQANYYWVGQQGNGSPMVSPISGFNWNTASSNASVMFDHVARAILGGFDGTASSLPNVISSGSTHYKAYSHTLPANQNENNVHVVGMIIDNNTGEILNAIKVGLSAPTANNPEIEENIKIYPNPIKNVLVIEGEYSSIDIYDSLGKLVLSSKNRTVINVAKLNNGIYILKMKTKKGNQSKKITINK